VFSRKTQIRRLETRLRKVEAELSEKRRLRSRLYARMKHIRRKEEGPLPGRARGMNP
jgi:hypothetical protein